jgi:hypothetical protein
MQEEYQQEESQIEAGTKYRSVEDLQSVGINMAEIKKLREAGYPTIGTVLQQPLKVLIGIKGFSEGKLRATKAFCYFLGQIEHHTDPSSIKTPPSSFVKHVLRKS